MAAERMYRGIGGEVTDQTVRAVAASTPMWLLQPLPLTRANPSCPSLPHHYAQHQGPSPSLRSLCLTVISRSFHTYDPTILAELPSHLSAQVLARVRDDRGYRDTKVDPTSSFRPDDATLWAYEALADPEAAILTGPRHTLALPSGLLLAQLAPNTRWRGCEEHPLHAVPRLFTHPNYTLLTTLTLSGMDAAVDDSTVQGLRHCTHLTVLSMRGCTNVTDDGIRMLAASVVLPNDAEEGHGMFRLRAWFLSGCTGIGDRSARSFARWPGLSVLDLRDTSCTDIVGPVLNRALGGLFALPAYQGGGKAQVPPFQPCSDGLVELFTKCDSPDDVLDKLCLTLLKPDLPLSKDDDTRRFLGLHVVSSNDRMPEDGWLHAPQGKAARQVFHAPASTYVGGGVGRVFGKGAAKYAHQAALVERKKKEKLQLALEFGAEDAHIAQCIKNGVAPPERRIEREKREREEWYAREKAEHKRDAKRRKEAKVGGDDYGFDPRAKWMPHVAGRKFSDRNTSKEERERAHALRFNRGVRYDPDVGEAAAAADERSRMFASGGKSAGRAAGNRLALSYSHDEVVQGERDVMLVRMAHPQWHILVHAVGETTFSREAEPIARVRKVANIDADIVDVLMSTQSQPAQSQSQQRSSVPPPSSPKHRKPFIDSSPSATPSAHSTPTVDRKPIIPVTTPTPSRRAVPAPPPRPSPFSRATPSQSSSQAARAAAHNPFRAKTGAAVSSSGVRMLDVKATEEEMEVDVKEEDVEVKVEVKVKVKVKVEDGVGDTSGARSATPGARARQGSARPFATPKPFTTPTKAGGASATSCSNPFASQGEKRSGVRPLGSGSGANTAVTGKAPVSTTKTKTKTETEESARKPKTGGIAMFFKPKPKASR